MQVMLNVLKFSDNSNILFPSIIIPVFHFEGTGSTLSLQLANKTSQFVCFVCCFFHAFRLPSPFMIFPFVPIFLSEISIGLQVAHSHTEF